LYGQGLYCGILADLNSSGPKPRRPGDTQPVGAVPLGVPLLVGPAVLTTIILLANQHGRLPAVLAIIANILLEGLTLLFPGLTG